MTITWINSLTNFEDIFIIEYPIVDAKFWYNIKPYTNDNDIINILNNLLINIDCTKEYSFGRPMMTTLFNYKDYISKYYYYLTKLNNQFIYNKFIDKLIKRHSDNILFEYKHPYIPKTIEKKKLSNKKKFKNNKIIKQETIDMFTRDKIYIFTDIKTGEQYETNNENFIEELNNRNKKKNISKNDISTKSITVNFKMKK